MLYKAGGQKWVVEEGFRGLEDLEGVQEVGLVGELGRGRVAEGIAVS